MSSHPLAGRRATLDEYHSLIREGVLGEDDRVQLLSGMIVGMTAQGHAHARVIQRLSKHFFRHAGEQVEVFVQLPLTLGDDSEPEPGLALVAPDEAARPDGHPRSALLVVEVSGDSLRHDREVKGAIYARARIREYWIVNLEARCIEVYRDPSPETGIYRRSAAFGTGACIAPIALAEMNLPVDALLD